MKRLFVASALSLVIALTGCATTEGEQGEEAAGTNRPTTEAPAVVPEETTEPPAPEPVEEAPDPSVLKFGETFTYEDGLSLTVSAPEPFNPSASAAGGESSNSHVQFQVTVVNGTKEAFDPNLFFMTLQSGNTEADEVFDSEQGFEGPAYTTVLPGREATWKQGFGVADPADLVLEVSPDAGILYERAIFTS